MHRGATAEVDLDAISHNLKVIRKITHSRPVIAVVKADAYGHGAVEVSKVLAARGVSHLAVAYTGEAVKLREAGITSRILVLFDRHGISDFFDYDLTPVIHDIATALSLSEEAKARGHHLDVHVKVDTGMGRLGINSREVLRAVMAIAKTGYVNVTGLMSHFSEADIADTSYAEDQLKAFMAIKEEISGDHNKGLLCHIANSAATLSFGKAHLDAVRPGLMLYGYSPFADPGNERSELRGENPVADLKPSMKVKTRILCLRRLQKGMPVSYGRTFITRRESLIAVLPVGYADGYSRALSNRADVIIRGKRVPVVGRVCMDLTMVDVTEVPGIEEEDEVVLIGRQGDEEITFHEIAAKAGTISYEIMTMIGSRSQRVYRSGTRD
ncbi:MAG TPA: alanine racemase [Thermodesulfovibrionales bacterium]|nr:alanine racemase [Thermodesulfovibrionales bacterium]